MEIRILITGGGTGGHAVPAIATAKAIARRLAARGDVTPQFLYIGSVTGIEKRLAEEAGIPFRGIATGKLRRARNPLSMINRANIADMLRVPVGFGQAMREVARFKPDVVFSTGGYVSVPTVLAAAAQHRPVVAHEQTVQLGLANKLIMRSAARVALSYPETVDEIAPALRSRTVVTGNPVRPIVLGGSAQAAKKRFGFADDDDRLPAIYITGGAQGSHLVNTAVGEELGPLLTIARVIHQCGRQPGPVQDFDKLTEIAASLPEQLRARYHLTEFVGDEIGDVFALSDLIVGRSGAGTVSEVCAVGRAALFVPLVPTGGDEQTRNARRLVDAGAAVVIPQDELTGTRLLGDLTALVSDRRRLAEMAEAARALARPNAAEDLADLVIATVRNRIQ